MRVVSLPNIQRIIEEHPSFQLAYAHGKWTLSQDIGSFTSPQVVEVMVTRSVLDTYNFLLGYEHRSKHE